MRRGEKTCNWMKAAILIVCTLQTSFRSRPTRASNVNPQRLHAFYAANLTYFVRR